MKPPKKLTAFVLAALMCAGCLAGCGTSPDRPDQEPEILTTPTHQATEPAGQEQTSPPPQPETPTEPAGDTDTVWVMSKQIMYRAEGFVDSFIEYSYDENGFLTGGMEYYGSGELIRDLDYYTYTIEDNIVTQYLVSFTDGTTSDWVYQFTFDEDGILRRVCLDSTSMGLRLRDWVPNYDENGNVISIDQYQNFDGKHQDTPFSTREFDLDENNHTINYGNEQITLDENGRPIKYMIVDRETGECDRDFYSCYEYMPIEVPTEFAAMAQGLANYYEPLYD